MVYYNLLRLLHFEPVHEGAKSVRRSGGDTIIKLITIYQLPRDQSLRINRFQTEVEIKCQRSIAKGQFNCANNDHRRDD